MKRLQSLQTLEDTATYLRTSVARIQYHLYVRGPSYRKFTLTKRSGAPRVICAPQPPIITWQKILARDLALSYSPYSPVYAYCFGRSIKENASRHVRKRNLFKIDLEDFFSSITFPRVYGLLMKGPFFVGQPAAAILAQLCTVEGVCAQGAPTSPAISNLICRRLDRELREVSQHRGVIYTRYSDDLTFSTVRKEFDAEICDESSHLLVGGKVESIISSNGFKINYKKVLRIYPHQRKQVTGLVVNSKVNVPRPFIRAVRAALHNWRTIGLGPASNRYLAKFANINKFETSQSFPRVLAGRINHIGFIRGRDDWIYARLGMEYSRLVGKQTFRLHSGRNCWNVSSFCQASVGKFLVCDSKENELGEATCFAIGPRLWLTACHVLDEWVDQCLEYSDLRLKILAPPWINSVEARIVHKCRIRDVMLIACGEDTKSTFDLSSHPASSGDQVVLIGYSNFGPGTISPRVAQTHVSSSTIRSTVKYIQLNNPIHSGDSGGVVVNLNGKVVGIAISTLAHGIYPNSCVSVENLKKFLIEALVSQINRHLPV